jgi:hypothetical protein
MLSWLSDVTPRATEPAKAHPQPPPQVVDAPRRPERRGRIELCTFPSGRSLAATKLRARNLN